MAAREIGSWADSKIDAGKFYFQTGKVIPGVGGEIDYRQAAIDLKWHKRTRIIKKLIRALPII